MKEFTEESILNYIKKKLPSPDARVLVGFGDDAAIYKIPSGKYSCITTDAFVENIHFSLKHFSFYDIGVKSLTSAISDIAAVGGTPSVAVLSLFLREWITAKSIDKLYNGIRAAARKYWVNIVGGDIVKANEIAIVFTIVGEIDKSNITLRSGAKPGDIICVTGNLGSSYTGHLLLEKEIDINAYGFQNIIEKHLRPEARIEESRKILETVTVHSMIDISDGLSTDLLHIAEESRVSVHIEASKIPVNEETKRAAALLKLDPIEASLKSGEEYELLFTISETDFKRLKNVKIEIPITVIGKVFEKSRKNMIVFPDGTTEPLIPIGYNHFRFQ
ncbi:MAG: thiamine-phosphate kinase [Candidatus Cloacimonadota bacterium]|nr:MAG: thiamine-phosphate kinase [Candidatus Cloacimonadota bacterium]